MKYQGPLGEYIEIIDSKALSSFLKQKLQNGVMGFFWFHDNGVIEIDGQIISFSADDILPITEFNQVVVQQPFSANFLAFNKSFYCILDHDHEVGCKGLLYFGTTSPPIIHFEEKDLHVLQAVWSMLEIEIETTDNLQLEMLQAMLKRLLIHITRVYKKQSDLSILKVEELELVRAYNYLVEENFRSKMNVSDYAKLLHRSPKTLSNYFKKLGKKTPLEYLHDRKMLEAKRLLSFTDKQISEIAFEIGFDNVHSFSKFFKKKQGVSPSDFAKGILDII